jgi:uncharacterized SAM-dependent methyltransferase
MRTPNLKLILETLLEDQPKPMSKEEKRAFMETVKNFSALGNSVYGKGDLHELTERVKHIVENSQRIMNEKADWFDQVSLKRENKRLQEDYNVFEQAARELKEAQDRMAMAYENIGQHLNRYFRVG